MLFEFPTEEDWRELSAKYPFGQLQIRVGEFEFAGETGDGFDVVYGRSEVLHWTVNLQHRLVSAYQSCLIVLFYYKLGIPDDEWYMSPGRSGTSIEYLPHLTKRHRKIKYQFDFFTDVFYYKSFSAWEAIGHLLFVIYALELNKKEKINFKLGVSKLEKVRPALYTKLDSIKSDDAFKLANKIRDDIAHNYPPHTVSARLMRFKTETENGISDGGANYTPSTTIKENITAMLQLLAKAIEALREQHLEDVALGLTNCEEVL